MEPETSFEQFFAARIKERGISLKKLADATGVAPAHIEGLLRGDFDTMPSAPYFRGYLIRLGEELGFDGEEWWKRLAKQGLIKNSGSLDTLPKNRFMKESPPKYLWFVGVVVLIGIYFAFQAPRILGKPSVAVTFPYTSPYTTASSTVTLTGTVTHADALYLNGSQEIPINPDGTWSETVLLGAGPNPFKITARKFLGSETNITETIIYQPPGGTATPSGATTTGTGTNTTNASGALNPASGSNTSATGKASSPSASTHSVIPSVNSTSS